MRILEHAGVSYRSCSYETNGAFTDGVSAAEKIGQPPERVYKRWSRRGAAGTIMWFVIPVAEELDLKAAAKAVSEKSVS